MGVVRTNGRSLGFAVALTALALATGCAREVSTEPHIPRWIPRPRGVELQIVDWQVGEKSLRGIAVGRTELDAEGVQSFYTRRLKGQGFEVEASPVLHGGEFAQVFARTRSRDRGLNVTFSGDGDLVVSFSQGR